MNIDNEDNVTDVDNSKEPESKNGESWRWKNGGGGRKRVILHKS